MGGARIVSFILVFVMGGALWGWMQYEKGNLPARTAFVQKQAEAALARLDEAGKYNLEANDRYAQKGNMLFIRFRYPERNPDDQLDEFLRMWVLLGRMREVRVEERSPAEQITSLTGQKTQRRRITVSGRDYEHGHEMQLEIRWILHHGNWLISGYADESPEREN